MNDEWALTPKQLADELGQSERWVKDQMAAGKIPSLKIGRHRWFTKACRDALDAKVEAQVAKASPADTWSRPGRS